VPQIVERVAPRLPQATQVCQLSATRFDRRELGGNVTPLLPQHIYVAGERGQDMEVSMTFGHQAGMKCAHRCDMLSRFFV